MAPKKGLGKGLDKLIPVGEVKSISNNSKVSEKVEKHRQESIAFLDKALKDF